MSEMPLFDHAEDPEEAAQERVFRVGEVNRAVQLTLEDRWSSVLIEGELSDVRRVAAGHVYFTLNDEDEQASLRGVMFRSDAVRTRTELEDGARVRFRGTLSLYKQRGQFQLIARWSKPAGEGDLAALFRKLHAKLQSEGLLDADRKRELPRLPKVVGVVTSVTGAAIRDIVRVAGERSPVRIVVADCRVQGQDAPGSIVTALRHIQQLDGLDVVIVSRGGGSAEDLAAFNDERVARAIAKCRVPVVAGVGHESDVTIADLVADVRAATPSNAAEVVVPERRVLQQELQTLERHLMRAMEGQIDSARLQLEQRLRSLYGSRRVVASVRGELNQLHQRLMQRDPRALLRADRRALGTWTARLRDVSAELAHRRRQRLLSLEVSLRGFGRPLVQQARAGYGALCGRLDALSPLRVLQRGYAIALHEGSGKAITSVEEVGPNERVRVRVSEGEFAARVEEDS